MQKKSTMHWSAISASAIQEQVIAALNRNKNYRSSAVLGLPASYLDPMVFSPDAPFLKEAPFARAFMENPNHIGCHTLVDGESAFEGTHALERELLAMCAEDMMGATPGGYDGYVASGGTEANIQAIWMYRNYFMEVFGDESRHVGVMYSADSHYSFYKAANVLQIQAIEIPVDVKIRQMTLSAFENGIRLAQANGVRALVAVFNMGTTMFGSVDRILDYLPLLKKCGMPYKIHIDGAFGGFIYPFTNSDHQLTFSNPEVSSITIDAHKMLQAPYGTGIFLTRKGLINYTHTHEASYVVGGDATLVGSRSGANLIAAWMIMKTYGYLALKQKMCQLIERTNSICRSLDRMEIPYFRNPEMNMLTIPRQFVPEALVEKYLLVPDRHDDRAYWVKIVVMEHVTPLMINKFISDLENSPVPVG